MMKKKLKEILARHGENQTNLSADAAQNMIIEDIQAETLNRDTPHDVDFLKELREWLDEGSHTDDTHPNCWVDDMLQKCVDHIDHLTDENQSLWGMLDEMKSADMKNYKKQFQTMLDRRVEQVRLLAKKPIKSLSADKKSKRWFQRNKK
jgi:hypothetical protein